MNECILLLKRLVKACEDILEDMKQQGLHLDGYGDDMDEARKYVTRAHKLFAYREEAVNILSGLAVRGVRADYLYKLTADDRARLRKAFNQCWDQYTYDPTPVDTLLAEFREMYDD